MRSAEFGNFREKTVGHNVLFNTPNKSTLCNKSCEASSVDENIPFDLFCTGVRALFPDK